jgi:hypothetical protein
MQDQPHAGGLDVVHPDVAHTDPGVPAERNDHSQGEQSELPAVDHHHDDVEQCKHGIENGGERRAGDYYAWGLHLNSHYGNWNLQLQHTEYAYNLNDITRMVVGSYGFYDSIAAEAKSGTVNLAYSWPVQWGPVTGLQFYNNYGLVYDKSDASANTMMNVTGFSVAAGGLFTYFDLVHARNQPFVGGSAAGNSKDTERRFNINIGYYF